MRVALAILLTLSLHAEDVVTRAQAQQQIAEQHLTDGRAARLAERQQIAADRLEATRTFMQLLQHRRTLEHQLTERRRQLATITDATNSQQALDHQHQTAITGAYQVPSLAAVADAITATLGELVAASTITTQQENIIDRHGNLVSVDVIRLGGVSALAVGDGAAQTGLLIEQASSRPRIAGPLYSAAQQQALAQFIDGKDTTLAIDVSGTLHTQATQPPWSIASWVAAGGPFAWAIVGIALLALIMASERAISLVRLRTSPALAEKVIQTFQVDGLSAAQALVTSAATPMARVLQAGLALVGTDRERMEAGLDAALLAEEPRFERSLTVLAACAAIAPLLGLLGTVTGMIGTFDVIALHGTGNPQLLSGGISEALVTTQMGLLAAVPLLLIHAALSRAVERRQVRLEHVATRLLSIAEKFA